MKADRPDRTASAEPRFNRITPAILTELREIVGASFVISDDTEALEPYGHDEIPDRRYAAPPEVVVAPRTAEEIAEIMRLANRENVPVTPRGAGSGLSGGAVPIHGGIVLRNGPDG
jgi:glycolate oxidase